MPEHTKPRIAILGAGTASLSTAYHLTEQPDWKDHFESITVYQLGWRAGGKGASGRGQHGRIEEHGLHVWLGWYHNSFRMIKKVYNSLARRPPNPLIEWDDAFKEQDYIVVADEFLKDWTFWGFNFPVRAGMPGDGGESLTLWQYVVESLQLIIVPVEQWLLDRRTKRKSHRPESLVGRLTAWAKHVVEDVVILVGLPTAALSLRAARALAQRLPSVAEHHWKWQQRWLVWLLNRFLEWFKKEVEGDIGNGSVEHHRLWILVDFTITSIRGAIDDGLLTNPDQLDAIDPYDYREWLRKHGGSDRMLESGLIRAVYDLLFAYVDGDCSRPSLAAGVAIRGILMLTFGYKGAIFYKMQAGMGDVVFAPIYQALRDRGVRFEFFHEVENLGLSQDKSSIETVTLNRQATVDPATLEERIRFANKVEDRSDIKLRPDEYYPLIDVGHLPCWPAWPNCDWLVEGEQLWPKASRPGWPERTLTVSEPPKFNLESFWTPWQGGSKVELKRGEDFDIVLLGIPVGAFPYICPELVEHSAKWRGMRDNIKTTRTLAMQLWFNCRLHQLGWNDRSPVMDAYCEPFNTWADMPQLIDREAWPVDFRVGAISYFCGTMVGGIPPRSDHGFPATALQEVTQIGKAWTNQNATRLWPDAGEPGGGFDAGKVLAGPPESGAKERWDGQFWRANIDPSEHYVLSVPGSIQYRILPGDTDFHNLFVTGDWVDNPNNAGCIEATVMASIEAANAIKRSVGWDEVVDTIIFGDHP